MGEDILLESFSLQILFTVLYICVFVIGVCGNLLVVFTVFRKKVMQTTTNIFITNLAVSDILMCLIAVPFTPVSFFMKSWIFGEFLCALIPMMMCVLVCASTFTCAVISIIRYDVILHPLRPKMGRRMYFGIIIFIWTISFIISWPLGHFRQTKRRTDAVVCREKWPDRQAELFFTLTIFILQYLVPCGIIIYSYVKISLALDKRSKSNLVRSCIDSEREQREIERKRRTNKMMIYVATVFVICWMPLNLNHTVAIFHATYDRSTYYSLVFFASHLVAMSSAVYNPFIYVFMSEKFRKEFKNLCNCMCC